MLKPILETIIFIVTAALPVCIIWPAAWLIYHQRKGWGWYLFAATLVVGSMRLKFDGFGS